MKAPRRISRGRNRHVSFSIAMSLFRIPHDMQNGRIYRMDYKPRNFYEKYQFFFLGSRGHLLCPSHFCRGYVGAGPLRSAILPGVTFVAHARPTGRCFQNTGPFDETSGEQKDMGRVCRFQRAFLLRQGIFPGHVVDTVVGCWGNIDHRPRASQHPQIYKIQILPPFFFFFYLVLPSWEWQVECLVLLPFLPLEVSRLFPARRILEFFQISKNLSGRFSATHAPGKLAGRRPFSNLFEINLRRGLFERRL